MAVARLLGPQRGTVRSEIVSFGTKQIGGADLHARSAKGEGRGDAAAVGDASGGDDRQRHGIDDLRHQRERPDLRCDIGFEEHAAMATGLGALGNDDVDAMLGRGSALRGRSSPST